MFLPLRDENPTRRAPIVTYGIIALNALVFAATISLERAGVTWLEPGYGLVPRRFEADPAGEAFTLVSSQFMHAGWLHFGSNMLFLHIFGDNLEDVLGRGRYAIFYLLGGVLAALAHFASDTHSMVPMVGASGAIAAVIGAYVLLFPRAPVLALNLVPPLWFLGFALMIPAWWVAVEFLLVNALPALVAAFAGRSAAAGGVAIYAHLGGLLAGLIMIRPWLRGRQVEPRQFRGFRRGPAPQVGGARWRRRRRPRVVDDED